MCGRIVYIWDAKTGQLMQRLSDDPAADQDILNVLHKKRYNVPPASHLPVIAAAPTPTATTTEPSDDSPAWTPAPRPGRIVVARWGFPIPKRPNGVFNTRIETAFDSPMWRGLIGRHHCLFPITGFYEWQRRGGERRTPHFVHRSDGEAMLLGGLIGGIGPTGAPLASIVTCPPNADMADLHDRMPVVIDPGDAAAWLHPSGDDDARRLAMPTAAGTLAHYEVGGRVGDTKHDDPDLMKPIGQTGLGAF